MKRDHGVNSILYVYYGWSNNSTTFPFIALWNLSLWILRPPLPAYFLPHKEQLTLALSSSSWTFPKCLLKCRLSENFLLQEGHSTRWDPSPCAALMWYFRGVVSVKAFGHWPHLNFLSLKWTPLVCLSLSEFDRNFFFRKVDTRHLWHQRRQVYVGQVLLSGRRICYT